MERGRKIREWGIEFPLTVCLGSSTCSSLKSSHCGTSSTPRCLFLLLGPTYCGLLAGPKHGQHRTISTTGCPQISGRKEHPTKVTSHATTHPQMLANAKRRAQRSARMYQTHNFINNNTAKEKHGGRKPLKRRASDFCSISCPWRLVKWDMYHVSSAAW